MRLWQLVCAFYTAELYKNSRAVTAKCKTEPLYGVIQKPGAVLPLKGKKVTSKLSRVRVPLSVLHSCGFRLNCQPDWGSRCSLGNRTGLWGSVRQSLKLSPPWPKVKDGEHGYKTTNEEAKSTDSAPPFPFCAYGTFNRRCLDARQRMGLTEERIVLPVSILVSVSGDAASSASRAQCCPLISQGGGAWLEAPPSRGETKRQCNNTPPPPQPQKCKQA